MRQTNKQYGGIKFNSTEDRVEIPKNQKLWVEYIENGKTKYLVTSTVMREKYFLYEVDKGGTLKKIASSKTPLFEGFDV